MRSRACVTIMCLAISACDDAPTATPNARSGFEMSAPVGNARIVTNTINPTGNVSGDGHHLTLTGPITCTAGETAQLRVTVTQRTTSAIAEGISRVICTGSPQTWQVELPKAGSESFAAGAAIAVALARTTDRGKLTDAHQWLVNVTLSQ